MDAATPTFGSLGHPEHHWGPVLSRGHLIQLAVGPCRAVCRPWARRVLDAAQRWGGGRRGRVERAEIMLRVLVVVLHDSPVPGALMVRVRRPELLAE